MTRGVENLRREGMVSVRVSSEEGNCIVCLEMRADELMRRLISGELTNYSVVRTSPEPLQLGAVVKNWYGVEQGCTVS
jgi:hypothetical protein